MDQKITWRLFDNNRLLVSRQNQEANHVLNKYLIYDTEDEWNKIDLENLIFYRKTIEYNMKIDFNNKTCQFIFDEKNTLKFDIECFIQIKEDTITLKYKIDDNFKEIIIDLE